MKITVSTDQASAVKVDLVAVGVREKQLKRNDAFARIDKVMGGALSDHAKDEDFKGRAGEVLKVPGRGRLGARWVALIGLGDGSGDPRVLASTATGLARKQKSVAIVLADGSVGGVRSAAEGAVLGAYKYTEYLTGSRKPSGGARSCVLLADATSAEATAAAKEGAQVGEATNLARDLVNAPPNDLNPVTLAERCKEEAKSAGITCTIWNKARIEKEGMNLFLAVNRGSAVEPRMIHMTYKPPKPKARVAFVGKGLTFDSGGLCIKPAGGMADMKCDMGGAATTIGIVLAAARLELPIEVHALIGSTENMTGAAAYRPGDVFTSLEGKTVEIVNTDAEGRLVLADVLCHAAKLGCDYLIDHATLTGACMVALGPYRAGLFGTTEEASGTYAAAADEAGEKFWTLPLDEDLRAGLDSSVADLKHTGYRFGGTISAALFLREFVGKSTWIHCDIAGPGFLDKSHGVHPKGGTGFGVSTGVRFLSRLANEQA